LSTKLKALIVGTLGLIATCISGEITWANAVVPFIGLLSAYILGQGLQKGLESRNK